ncbi:DUF5368 family protein [Vandammella animalimorsus]|uniref:Uncharacterized protein n=1 Tax=Vandammella animalimorsus TaxID=2029117 RepID=A0A2A2AGA9_9BURK|nr:DUF5368 family protein [Vandammella animalimorsus]PAT36778.1 hypothetical protein CK625_09865 [Vandammella animalimorsus]
MKELDFSSVWAVLQEMLGAPLLIALPLISILGTLAFLLLLLRERRLAPARLVACQFLGLLGGVLAVALMFQVASSGTTSPGGAIDWLVIGLVYLLGMIGTTIVCYSIAGWFRQLRAV